MLDKKYVRQLKDAVAQYAIARRTIIRLSDDVRNASKRAIFAMHRDDTKNAEELLSGAAANIVELQKSVSSQQELIDEGSFRSALEEYVEARLYQDFLAGKTLGKISVPGVEIPYEVYLGGLSDVAGEMQRRQVRLATVGDLAGVQAIRDAIEEIVGELLEIDLTGYLRNKFDQTKNCFRRAEETLYEVSLRRK
jgi:predicted translin family RNA/ssDNA-binding protein